MRDYHIPVVQVDSYGDLVNHVKSLDNSDAFRVHIILICSRLDLIPKISGDQYLC